MFYVIHGSLFWGHNQQCRKITYKELWEAKKQGYFWTKASQSTPPIYFIREDKVEVTFPHDDPFVTRLFMWDYFLKIILVNTDSLVDIIFSFTLEAMKIPPLFIMPENPHSLALTEKELWQSEISNY